MLTQKDRKFREMRNDTSRTILHCDMNGFYASVELLDYPQYREVPMAVCGNPDSRHGIILAKNDLAKKYKVTTGETLGIAQKKCPTLVCVEPHHDKYNKYSKLINQIYLRYTDMPMVMLLLKQQMKNSYLKYICSFHNG